MNETGNEGTGYTTLEEVRAAIDALDRSLVTLLTERMRCIVAAARIKQGHGEALVPWRVEEVVRKIRNQAVAVGFDPDMAEAIWRDIIRHSVNFEAAQLP
jgi:isochorismate pyruvate lyase